MEKLKRVRWVAPGGQEFEATLVQVWQESERADFWVKNCTPGKPAGRFVYEQFILFEEIE